MPSLGDRNHRIMAINFPDTSPSGLVLHGNHLTVIPRPILFATRTGQGPWPTLARTSDGPREPIPHGGEFTVPGTDRTLFFWRLNRLAEDGDYELESIIRYDDGDDGILSFLYGRARFAVEYGCLARVAILESDYQPPIDIGIRAVADRVRGIMEGKV